MADETQPDRPDPAGEENAAVSAVAAGDVRALEQLYRRYGRLAFSIAFRITGDRSTAEECTQDAFLALWKHAAEFDPARGRLSSWLFTVSRNAAIRAVRRRRPTVEPDETELASSDPAPDELVLAADAAEDVARAMAELPPPQLEVVQLAYFDELSQTEIAERLSLPLGTVKGRMRLALDRLRASLETGDIAGRRG
ncbi:MAG TPA: sigma-70 family RNA polymerase sigma factor [Gaiellaceae bacterium]|nr:sigma-70 family RNA polymerase sigma factor [Gaiellaceae bacterium]